MIIIMENLKIGIIGAGSSYTPELIEKLAEIKAELPIREIAFMDTDAKRLEIMTAFCRRFAANLDYDVKITSTTSRQEAIEGADFVDVQIRVGGNSARVTDEKIPMKYGLIGQETTGIGGFMNAMRTIPAMLEIAHDVEKYSPDAWIVNYTNPTGLVAEAVNKYSKARIAGLCAGGLFPGYWTAKALGVKPASVRYDYIGLNHMNFSFNISVDGKTLTDEEFDKVAEMAGSVDSGLIKKMRLIPSPYLQYYFHTGRKLREMKEAEYSRAEVVLKLENEVFAAYADPRQCTKPDALAKRGGGGYSEVALGMINAIYNNRDTWMIINVPNQGAVKFLPDDAVIETGCLVNRSGIHPLALNQVPPAVWGLISAVKNYEQLAVEAAVTGNKDTAVIALLAHPLVKDYDVIPRALDDLFEANKSYLPQFFKD
jgi:6-phospho-beta-glucosidase